MEKKAEGSAALAAVVASMKSLSTALSRSPSTAEEAKEILGRLFDLVCDLATHVSNLRYESRNLETDRSILQAWHSLLTDTKKLCAWKEGDGHFIAVRMILFISHAFREQFAMPRDLRLNDCNKKRVQAQMDFLFAVDEALLIELRAIWDRSGGTEYFDWALTHIDRDLSADHNRTILTCLTPTELLSLSDLKRATIWVPEEDDPPIFHRFREATASVSGEMDENHNRPLIQQTLYDGPLRAPPMQFSLYNKRDTESIDVPRLPRSKQFVLDARAQRYPHMVTNRNTAIHGISTKYRLPVELQDMIAGKLEEPHQHPYVSHLDLSAAYQPFPTPSRNTDQSDGKKPNRGLLNGPETSLKTVYVWNYALRAFHVFHEQEEGGTLRMCGLGLVCPGHYAADEQWKVESYEEFCDHLLNIVTLQCAPNPDIGLSAVGVGAEFDDSGDKRDLHMFPHYGLNWEDIENEICFSGGGFASLPEAMCADRVKMACFRHEGYNLGEFVGNTTIEDWHLWARVRQLGDERRCQAALKSLLYGEVDDGDDDSYHANDDDESSDEDSNGRSEYNDDQSDDE